MDIMLASTTVSVTELKRNFSEIIKQADDSAIAILNHNRPEAYLLTAAHYEQLMEHVENLEDAQLVKARADGPFVEVSIDAL